MLKKPLLNFNLAQMKEIVVGLGDKKFRAMQIFDCLLNGRDIRHANIPKSLIEKLDMEYELEPVKIVEEIKSSDGQVSKFLFELADGEIVEGVLMKYKYGNSFCLSTQVGCRMNCAFCASGLCGLIRNLYAGEMLGIIAKINSLEAAERNVTNIVLMGSGEPLDNFDEVCLFLNLITSSEGLNFSSRCISLSTCGLCDKIKMLPEHAPPVTLSISLHASNDEARQKIMPIAKRWSIKKVIDSAKYYFDKTGRRIAFEYALIKGVNDSDKNINELSKLLKGLCCFVNVISLNPVKERNLIGKTRQDAYEFVQKLKKTGIMATLRRTLGNDIEGACGQLRNKRLSEKKEK